jgi:phosphatidylserine/phosphatidylglycerophosphate/cardiolipin synthase-like enzyme
MKRNPRNIQIAAILIGLGLLLVAYLLQSEDAELSDTLRDVAELVLTTEGEIDPTLIGVDRSTPPTSPTPPATPLPATSTPAPVYQIYFTEPTCPPEAERHGGLDDRIAADLLQAQTAVDIAAFDLDLPSIVDALVELETRGLPVRVVTDSDNTDLASIRRLRRNGISVVEDKRSGLMHNKFIIIDGRYLWTGSLNLTTNGVYCNNNNFVRFDAPALAANYTAELSEMYEERSFGPKSPVNTPAELLTVAGIHLENYFAPERELELVNVLARTVARAQSEILFLAYSFTNEEIGEAMLGRADAGIPIRGVFERVGAESGYYPRMRDAGLPNVEVRLDGNPALLHHKVIIVDRTTVIFGSFNFSSSANRNNDENLVIVQDGAFAAAFVQEFERRWAEARE